MPICQNCNKSFPYKVVVNEKDIFLNHRKNCLKCNPLGERLFYRGKRVSPKDENGKRILIKQNFICKNCNREFKHKTRNKICSSCRNLEKRHKQRKKAIERKGKQCIICGYNKCYDCLDFHHIKGTDKNFNLSTAWQKKWEEIENEIQKCFLLCRNCHGEYHSGAFCLLVDAPIAQ